MHEPEDTAIEQVASEAPESEDFDLSDEALDRPAGGEAFFCGKLSAVCVRARPRLSVDRPVGEVRSFESRDGRLGG